MAARATAGSVTIGSLANIAALREEGFGVDTLYMSARWNGVQAPRSIRIAARMFKTAVRRGRGKRGGEAYPILTRPPTACRNRRGPGPYVEPLSAATCLREALRRRQGTKLEAVFNILLVEVTVFPVLGSIQHRLSHHAVFGELIDFYSLDELHIFLTSRGDLGLLTGRHPLITDLAFSAGLP